VQWNATNYALWSDLDERDLPHFIAGHEGDNALFWEHFPTCKRTVVNPEPDEPGRVYTSVWLADPVDEERWEVEARKLRAIPPRVSGKFGRPDLELGGAGLAPPRGLWLQHPAIARFKLYYDPGVEATEGAWHVFGGSDMWACDVWLKKSAPNTSFVSFGDFLGRRLRPRR
jgi:hypothetical protein